MQKKVKKFFKLEYYRKKFNITQVDMAKLLGITQGAYSAKINGRSSFNFDEMIIVLELFNKKAKKTELDSLTLDEIFLG